MGKPEWVNDPRFDSNPHRTENVEELTVLMNEVLKTRTTKEWIAELEAAGVPCAPINNVAQVMEDPSIIARNMIVEVEHPVAGKLKVPGIPIKLSETPGEILTPAPLLAADTNEIMKEFFGWDEATTKAKLGE